MPGIINFDLVGYSQRDQNIWDHDLGTVLTVDFFDIPPDLPTPLSAPLRLFAETAKMVGEAGGGLIEAEIQTLDSLPALWQLAKFPHPQQNGLVFVGAWTIPRAVCSIVIKVVAAEQGITGMREAVVMSQLGLEGWARPSPYAPELQMGLPFIRADEEQYDGMFSDHPLSLVRRRAKQLLPTIRVHPEVRNLPAFE
jgi:hypothetical protein